MARKIIAEALDPPPEVGQAPRGTAIGQVPRGTASTAIGQTLHGTASTTIGQAPRGTSSTRTEHQDSNGAQSSWQTLQNGPEYPSLTQQSRQLIGQTHRVTASVGTELQHSSQTHQNGSELVNAQSSRQELPNGSEHTSSQQHVRHQLGSEQHRQQHPSGSSNDSQAQSWSYVSTPSPDESLGARPRPRTSSFRVQPQAPSSNYRNRNNSFDRDERPSSRSRRRAISISNTNLPPLPATPNGEDFPDARPWTFPDSSSRSDSRQQQSQPNDIQIEGEELYLHFFHEQLRSEGLDNTEELEVLALHNPRLYHHYNRPAEEQGVDEAGTASSSGVESSPDRAAGSRHHNHHRHHRHRNESMNLENFENPMWREAGRDLRVLAESFSRSHERTLIRERAESVNVSSLDSRKFMQMLSMLFEDGKITRERILALFFFCSDLAIRAVKSKMHGFLGLLTEWTLEFIRNRVCQWVQSQGGWESVLRSGLNVIQQLAFIGACGAIITACVIYVKRNLGGPPGLNK